jgi:hypothetical protein
MAGPERHWQASIPIHLGWGFLLAFLPVTLIFAQEPGGERKAVLEKAAAYEEKGNRVWARRTLTEYLAANEGDCEVRAHLAAAMLRGADYRAAKSLLARAGCPVTPTERTRWLLLEAMAEEQAGNQVQAADLLDKAESGEVVYSEDEPLFPWLSRRLRPLRTPPLEIRLKLGGGWSSNPLLGAPMDPQASEKDYASAVTEGDLWGRMATPHFGAARLYLEGLTRYQYFFSDPAGDLSYVGWGVKPGVELEWLDVAVRAAYHFDSLLIAASDPHHESGHWFFEAHRGEVELDVSLGMTFFLGGGRRLFSTMGRTRWELDGGIGGTFHLGKGVHLLGAATGRRYWATTPAHNLTGYNLLLALSIPLFRRFQLRGSASSGMSWYPDSAGALAFHSPEARRDIQVRGRLGIWTSPLIGKLSMGATYEPVRRWSTAKLYEFTDHTLMLMVGWRGSADPWLPAPTSSGLDRSAVNYGIAGDTGFGNERLQDLLRQDEEAQRGSSCLE